jgi:phosphohistidine phosphatase
VIEFLDIAESSRVLLVLRHGKSDWDADYDQDFSRPLAPRGVKAARKMAAFIAKLGLEPELIISSPAHRALRTAGIVAEELEIEEPQQEMAIYGGGYERLSNVARKIPHGLRVALLVGHNPGLENLVEGLTGESYVLMKTCSLAVLEGRGDSWSSPENQTYLLRGVFHPRELPEAD